MLDKVEKRTKQKLLNESINMQMLSKVYVFFFLDELLGVLLSTFCK